MEIGSLYWMWKSLKSILKRSLTPNTIPTGIFSEFPMHHQLTAAINLSSNSPFNDFHSDLTLWSTSHTTSLFQSEIQSVRLNLDPLYSVNLHLPWNRLTFLEEDPTYGSCWSPFFQESSCAKYPSWSNPSWNHLPENQNQESVDLLSVRMKWHHLPLQETLSGKASSTKDENFLKRYHLKRHSCEEWSPR